MVLGNLPFTIYPTVFCLTPKTTQNLCITGHMCSEASWQGVSLLRERIMSNNISLDAPIMTSPHFSLIALHCHSTLPTSFLCWEMCCLPLHVSTTGYPFINGLHRYLITLCDQQNTVVLNVSYESMLVNMFFFCFFLSCSQRKYFSICSRYMTIPHSPIGRIFVRYNIIPSLFKFVLMKFKGFLQIETDIAQIQAHLVHNTSRSQLYLGFGHFGWLLSFFGQLHFGRLMVKLYCLCWNYSLSSGWHIISA